MAEANSKFPVDKKLMEILPLAGATFNHPNAPERPDLEQIEGKWYLVFRMREHEGQQALEVSRHLPLDDFSDDDLISLQQCYFNLDFRQVIDVGLRKGLSHIENPKIRSSFLSLLSTLNPRHVAMLMYLYRAAHEQRNGPVVEFDTNHFLNELYERSNSRGIHDSSKRGQLRRDLWALHRNEIHYSDPMQSMESTRLRILVRTPITIEAYDIEKERLSFADGKFDWGSEQTDRTPDAFVVKLNFYRSGGSILFPKTISLRQPKDLQTSRNCKSKLLYYLISKLSDTREGDYFYVTLDDLFAAMELKDSNPRRKKSTVLKSVEQLKADSFLLGTQEMFNEKKLVGIKFLFNSAMASVQPEGAAERN